MYASSDEAGLVHKNPPIKLVPDYTVIEIQRYVALIESGDPRSVESLFISPQRLLATSPMWEQLVGLREQLVSQQMVEKYVADATGKNGLAAVRKGKRPMKHPKMLYVALRTLQNALELCLGQGLCIERELGTPNYVTRGCND